MFWPPSTKNSDFFVLFDDLLEQVPESTCIDHIISKFHYEKKTIESNIIDHFPISTLLDEKICPSDMDAQNKKIRTWVRNYTFL